MTSGLTRVLIVEDHSDLREFMQVALELAGYEVETASQGEAALRAQSQRPAAVVITDIFMPQKDGIETINEFRSRFPEVRIIAISGGASIATKSDYLSVASQVGADETLRKPFELDALLAAIARLTKRQA